MSGLKYFYFPVIRQSSDLYSYVNVAYFYTIENWYILSLKEPGQLLKWHKNLVYELVLWELTHQVLSPNSASSAGLHKILTKKNRKYLNIRGTVAGVIRVLANIVYWMFFTFRTGWTHSMRLGLICTSLQARVVTTEAGH